MSFFADSDYYTGPSLTAQMIEDAEAVLRVRLPRAYLDLLRERNGGVPQRQCYRTTASTSWAPNHIKIAGLRGLGGDWGIDSPGGLGSASMISEWGYPSIGVVICDTP